MKGTLKRIARFLSTNWERVLFGLVGFACLVFTFRLLIADEIPAASAVFAMAFFSFFYSNLARFRRFKGFGFEAELWEDKQKEAASLISRLQNVVSIYSREIVMGRVMRGRSGGSEPWSKRWALFDTLIARHKELGQEIDFTPLRQEVESAFLFDICTPLASSTRKAIDKAKADLSASLQGKYGSPVTDLTGWNLDHQRLQEVESGLDDLFARAQTENIARAILTVAERARDKLDSAFQFTPDYNEVVIARLRTVADLADTRPIAITPTLLEWADDRTLE